MAWVENGRIVESLDKENFESWIEETLTPEQWERISKELALEISARTEEPLQYFAEDYFNGVFDEKNEGETK